MNRIALYIIIASVLCGGGYAAFTKYTATIQRLTIAEQANNVLASTVTQQAMRINVGEKAAAIYAERAYHYQQQSITSRTELASLKGKHNETDRYLATLSPDAVAVWLFLRSHCEDKDDCDYTAILSAAGYASASTTTEEIYQWCKDTAAALTQCNGDKAQARESIANQATIVKGTP